MFLGRPQESASRDRPYRIAFFTEAARKVEVVTRIAPELRDKHGYTEITPALRAKIFGSSALKIYPVAPDVVKKHVRQDKVALQRQEYRERRDPAFVTYGPKTRREFLNLLSWG